MTHRKPSAPVVLFMSVDIIESTSYKVRYPAVASSSGWLDAFENFFRMTPLRFIGRIAEAYTEHEGIPECSVWRVQGDEIIFIALPTSAAEIYLINVAFLRTVYDCNEVIMNPHGLSVRGCFWAAQLGGRNRPIDIPEMHPAYIDYLGPDVDTGFRLTSFAGAGEVSFSYNVIGVFEALASTSLHFRLLGMNVLKGVIMHEPYPVVVAKAKYALPDRSEPLDPSDMSAAEVLAAIRAEHPNPSVLESGAIVFD